LKVLLTGANGFVGSHILDSLRARGIPTAILLRPSSDRGFIEPHLASVEIRPGSITDLESLRRAMPGVTHVIHCAGLTKARNEAEFFAVNQAGTANVVTAINEQAGSSKRLVHLSSLAAIGPAGRERPARVEDEPHPVSQYGRSKLAGEAEVRQHCRCEYAIVRPPAVYGPRDRAFLSLFSAVKSHLLPRTSASQALSIVYVSDLAEAVIACLDHPKAAGRTYFAAAPEIVTGRQMAEEIALQMGSWTIPLPMPTPLFWPVCMARELWSRLTRKASLLNMQKFAELRAPGWVCDPSLLKSELAYECPTLLKPGIARSLAWYLDNAWL
jgi:2-alkyl-3-oxoalkanoate reductase